ncbi:hypothetical protein MHBO_001046 [Bonamia ostreae]|uniref:BZIP domain-containing protein n=1 Tax=Bonamia ostreae TaxID=126728 RepID=A0ABV2AHP8_9EUKA
MSEPDYRKPKTVINTKGEKTVYSAYTNRPIKTYPGETDETRNKRLQRNFIAARNKRVSEKNLIRSLKEDLREIEDYNQRLREGCKILRKYINARKCIYGSNMSYLNNRVDYNSNKLDCVFKPDLSNWSKADEEKFKREEAFYKEEREVNRVKLLNNDITEYNFGANEDPCLLTDDSEDYLDKQLKELF